MKKFVIETISDIEFCEVQWLIASFDVKIIFMPSYGVILRCSGTL